MNNFTEYLKRIKVDYIVSGSNIVIERESVDANTAHRIYAYAKSVDNKASILNDKNFNDRKTKKALLRNKKLCPQKVMQMTGWNYPKAYRFLKENGYEWERPSIERVSKRKVLMLYNKGLSQSEIAKRLDCTRQYVSLVLKGARK